MGYVLLQRSMERPSVAALERAFASGRGLTPADARFVADDAFGILARELSLDDALFLQQALSAENLDVEVVPESDLPRLPDPKLFRFVTCEPDTLVVYDPLERPLRVPWSAISVIAAGFDQRDFRLELVLGDCEARFLSNLDRLDFGRMPQYTEPAEPDNVGARCANLVRDLRQHCPKAVVNRAAFALTREDAAGDVTAEITYPRPMAYTEELTWILWRVRSSLASSDTSAE